jgi:hypothetical protein
MTNQPQFDVFLAHNSQDKPQVRAIARELKQRGLYYWIDEEQIPPGRSFQDVIQLAIPNVKSAAIFIGLVGFRNWQAMVLRALISRCIDADIPVIPVLLPGVDKIPEHLSFLKEFNPVRFASRIDDVEALNNLEWGITGRKPKLILPIENSTDKFRANVFICYSDEDVKLRKRLEETCLSTWEGEGFIKVSYKDKILGGKNLKAEIDKHLDSARLILLLITPSFMSSYYNNYQDIKYQVDRAMQREKIEQVDVIPVLLEAFANWFRAPFGQLNPLPKNGKFVNDKVWRSKTEAFYKISEELAEIIEEIRNS